MVHVVDRSSEDGAGRCIMTCCLAKSATWPVKVMVLHYCL